MKHKSSSTSSSAYDVFLGGSCNPTTWRTDLAIPFLKSHAITFYNPQQPNWVPEMIELEHQAKQTSKVLFYVLSNKTRNIVSMMEIAYYAGSIFSRGWKLVVVLEPYDDDRGGGGRVIQDEVISGSELRDLTSGLVTVHDLVERQDVPVFQDIRIALECAVKLIQLNLTPHQLTIEDGARPVRHAHLQLGDKILRMREAFATLACQAADSGGRHVLTSLADLKMAFRIHTHKDLSQKDLRSILRAQQQQIDNDSDVTSQVEEEHVMTSSVSLTNQKIKLDFDAFCCIVAEFRPSPKNNHPAFLSGGNSSSSKVASSGGGDCKIPANSSRPKKTFLSISKTLGQACKAFFGGGNSTASATNAKKSCTTKTTATAAKNCAAVTRPTATATRRSRAAAAAAAGAGALAAAGAAGGGGGGVARRGSSIRDVYLGGSTAGKSSAASAAAAGNWRETEAIPVLKKNGLTFFRPLRRNTHYRRKSSQFNFEGGSPEQPSAAGCGHGRRQRQRRSGRRLMPIEASAMDNSRVLLFVIQGNSRSLSALCEAAYHIGLGRSSVVLCVQKIPDEAAAAHHTTTSEEGGRGGQKQQQLSKSALKDYNRGRSYLSDFANREGVPVFESVSEAIDCVVQKCKATKNY